MNNSETNGGKSAAPGEAALEDAVINPRKEIYGNIDGFPAEDSYLVIINELERALLEDNDERIGEIKNRLAAILEETVACDLAKSKTGNPGGNFSRKPIEVAAREGLLSCVQHFLHEGGMNVNDVDNVHQTLLHHATIKNNLKLLKYLIQQGADVNGKDNHGSTPLHLSAIFGTKDTIEILLKNGAIFDEVDNDRRTALDLASDPEIIKYLSSTNKLFESVKKNDLDGVKDAIKEGAFVDAKNGKGTPLHYAAWKGYAEIADILLNNEANPSSFGNNGLTPLHFASKFSRLKIVKNLLAHGAIYNAVSTIGKTPRDLTENDRIDFLFGLIDTFFTDNGLGDGSEWDILQAQGEDTINAVLNARNEEGDLCIILRDNDTHLKAIEKWGFERRVWVGQILETHWKPEKALQLFKSALKMTRNKTDGSVTSNSVEVRIRIANFMQRQGQGQEALDLYEDILQRRIELLGPNNTDTLLTHCWVALAMYNLGRGAEALQVYQKIVPKLVEKLGPDDERVIESKNQMGIVLGALGNYGEALKVHREVYDSAVRSVGPNGMITAQALCAIADDHINLHEYEEALGILRGLLDTKLDAPEQSETLFHLDVNESIGTVLVHQRKYKEALVILGDVLAKQKNLLPPNHPMILSVEMRIANAQRKLGKLVFEKIDEISERKGNFGPAQSMIFNDLDLLNASKSDLMQYAVDGDIHKPFQEELYKAAVAGNAYIAEMYAKTGIDVNYKDAQGATALHQAVNQGHTDIVYILLNNGARVNEATNKGNTPLHTAALKNNLILVNLLLSQVSGAELNALVDAQTTTGGNTALHVAAEKGFLHIVKCLLKFGAMYNLKNKDKKMPADLSSEMEVTDLLKMCYDSFESVENGDVGCIAKLRERELDEFFVIAKARNDDGQTLLQVAMLNKRADIADYVLKRLKLS